MSDTLIIETQANHVVWITFNRPEQNNLINRSLATSLRDSLRELAKNKKIRALVLTGAGDHFCQGVDPAWVQNYQSSHVSSQQDPGSEISAVFNELDNFPAPTIARINGNTFGVGVGLAACCDIIVCQKNAHFAANEVQSGLAPIASTPYIMATIGAQQARRWLLTGETSPAEKALELGFAHVCVDAEQLDAAVEEQISHLLLGAPGAQREIKQWIKEITMHGHTESPSYQRAEGVMFKRCLNSKEAQKGIQAMIDNELPPWRK